MILLTDAEIPHKRDNYLGRPETMRHIAFKAGAKAQIGKLYNWGNEDCPHAGYVLENPLLHKRECSKCWQELLKEVE